MILTVTLNASIDKLYLMESIRPETVMRVKEVHNTAGGKGLNVSRVSALLNEPVITMGFTGGFNGRYLESLISGPLIRPTSFSSRQYSIPFSSSVWQIFCDIRKPGSFCSFV